MSIEGGLAAVAIDVRQGEFARRPARRCTPRASRGNWSGSRHRRRAPPCLQHARHVRGILQAPGRRREHGAVAVGELPPHLVEHAECPVRQRHAVLAARLHARGGTGSTLVWSPVSKSCMPAGPEVWGRRLSSPASTSRRPSTREGTSPPLHGRLPRLSALAQLVEQLTVNQRVAGSSPAGGANSLTLGGWQLADPHLPASPRLDGFVRPCCGRPHFAVADFWQLKMSGFSARQYLRPGRERPGPRRWGRVAASGGPAFDDEFLAQRPQRRVDAANGGPVTRIEHAADLFLVDAQPLGEGDAGQPAVAQCERQRCFRCRHGRNRHQVLTPQARARLEKWECSACLSPPR